MKQMTNFNPDPVFTQSIPLSELVKSMLTREEDIMGTKFRKYYEIGKDIFRELNLYAIRWSKRYLIEVDTAHHSITLPDDCLLWSSIQVIDDCGKLVPLMLNKNITGDIADINLHKPCGCKCNCQDTLCGQLKNYEVIYKDVSAEMPDGSIQVFKTYSRKAVYPNGEMYQEWTEPVVQYDPAAEIVVATELQTFRKHLCTLEVKACGCVVDNACNCKRIEDCCGPDFLTTECCKPYCMPNNPNIWFGYQQLGRIIQFDSNFCFDHVLLRYYPEFTGNFQVPLLAKKAMILGIKNDELSWDFSNYSGYKVVAKRNQHDLFDKKYSDAKEDLFRLLNRISLKQFYHTILTPGRRFIS